MDYKQILEQVKEEQPIDESIVKKICKKVQ